MTFAKKRFKDYWVVFTLICNSEDSDKPVPKDQAEVVRHTLYRTFSRSESFLMKSNFFRNKAGTTVMFYCVVTDGKLAERIESRMFHMIKDGVIGGEAQHADSMKEAYHLIKRQKRFYRYNFN